MAELRDRVRRFEACASAEEGDGLALGERRHAILELSLDTQELARGDEQSEVGADAGQRSELRRCFDHVLEVVHEEQQLPFADVVAKAVPGTEGLGDGLGDEGRLAKGRETDPEDPSLEAGTERRRGFDRDPGFARAAGARQGDETGATFDRRAHLLELPLSADEGARRTWEVRVRDRR
jgi:hypothetical protein